MHLFSPTLKSTDGVPLKRETAIFINASEQRSHSDLTSQIFNAVTRQMTLFKLLPT